MQSWASETWVFVCKSDLVFTFTSGSQAMAATELPPPRLEVPGSDGAHTLNVINVGTVRADV